MIRASLRWVNGHRRLTAVLLLASLVVGVNGMAYLHAHAMTHFVDGGQRTAKPDELSIGQKIKVLLTGVRISKSVNTEQPEDYSLDAEVHEFAGASGDRLEGWYISADDSRALCIMFHGYAASRSRLLAEAKAFVEQGCDVFLVDFRGCGGSDGYVSTIGYLEAEDVAAAVAYAQESFRQTPLLLYGQSMGAVAVTRAVALKSVSPTALIMECPFDRLLSTTRNRFAAMGLPSFPLAELLVFWGGQQHGFSGFGHNPEDYAAQIDRPVFLMSGQDDDRVTEEQVRAVYDQFGGDKQLVMFPDTGHEACLQGDAELWRESVGKFPASVITE